jgi:hypothetical protein
MDAKYWVSSSNQKKIILNNDRCEDVDETENEDGEDIKEIITKPIKKSKIIYYLDDSEEEDEGKDVEYINLKRKRHSNGNNENNINNNKRNTSFKTRMENKREGEKMTEFITNVADLNLRYFNIITFC